MQQFKDNGGSQNKLVMEFRAPLGHDLANVTGQEAGSLVNRGSRWTVRMRGYYNTVNFNDPANDKFNFDFGLGKSLNEKWKIAFILGYNLSRQFEYEKYNTNEIIYRLRIYNLLI